MRKLVPDLHSDNNVPKAKIKNSVALYIPTTTNQQQQSGAMMVGSGSTEGGDRNLLPSYGQLHVIRPTSFKNFAKPRMIFKSARTTFVCALLLRALPYGTDRW